MSLTSLKLSAAVATSQARLTASEEAISSLEYTHDWEMQSQGHSASDTYRGSWGLHMYVSDTTNYDVGWRWGTGYSSTKVFLGDGDDRIYGNLSSDKVHTGAGNDYIRGGAGNDQLLGGDGDDIIYGDEGNDILFGGNGNDTIYAGTGSTVRYYGTKVFPRVGLSDNYYSDGDDVLLGGDGDDTLIDTGTGNNVFAGGRGMDLIHMGRGQNVVVIDPAQSENYFGYDFITGFNSDDILSMPGLSGDEKSVLDVQFGLDIYWVERDGDTIIYAGRGSAPDEIIAVLKDFTGLALENFGIVAPEPAPLPVVIEQVKAPTIPKPVIVEPEPQPQPKPEPTSEVTQVVEPEEEAPAFNVITGTPASETIEGTEVADYISGLAGHDWVSGREGDDILRGGDGDDNIYGNTGDDVLYGDAGNDQLRGGEGSDYLIGGDGTDVGFFLYERAFDPIQTNLKLKANSGKQFKRTPEEGGEEGLYYRFWIDTNNNGRKDKGDEFDYYQGIENFALKGGSGNDRIIGADGSDDLRGAGGNDRLDGRDGGDRLNGGDGNDVLRGGNGDDILIGGAGRDKLIGGKGDDKFHLLETTVLRKADIIKDFTAGDELFFGKSVDTVYARVSGKNTILQNGSGPDAEVYAVLKGYTETLTDSDASHSREFEFVYLDVV